MKQKQLLKQILFEQQKTNELLQNIEIRQELELKVELEGKELAKALVDYIPNSSRMTF